MVRPGDHIPDLGAEYTRLWHHGPALLVWMRHFGCQFYPETLTALRDAKPAFDALGVTVKCIVQGDSGDARAFCGALDAESLCIADPDRHTYRMMGFERATLRSILFPSRELHQRRCEVRAKGFRQDWRNSFRRNADPLQLPGAALIGADGIVRWLHRGKHTGDLPDAATLIAVSEKVTPKTTDPR